MSNRLRAVASRARLLFPGLLELGGAAALSLAAWMVYHPAGVGAAGVLALLKVYDLERK